MAFFKLKRKRKKIKAKLLFKRARPIPDYTSNTCKADLDFINSQMGLKYEDLNLDHLTVIWEWLKSKNPPNTFGYDSAELIAKINRYRNHELTITKTDKNYELYLSI